MAAKTQRDPAQQNLLALTDRAQQGDKTALPALREFFEKPGVVEATGNLARMARDSLVEKYCGKNLLIKEGLTRKMDALRAELAGAAPAPLEGLLAERVVACWLHLHHLEMIYATKESMSLELGTFYQRSICSAQNRYLAAIKTLALVRKLAVPVLQVNFAKRQMNVAGPSLPADISRGQLE